MTGFPGRYPATRLRRLRRHDWLRRLVAEARLSADDLIWPLFVTDGVGVRERIPNMAEIYRYSVDQVGEQIDRAAELGIRAVALFPNTPAERRSEDGAEALNPDNLVCCALRQIGRTGHPVGVIVDVALDPYTSHGHDGLLRDGEIHNDASVEILARQAVVLAEAGADILAPSDMMDGRVGAIRAALDAAGHEGKSILSYAAKYASSLFGPFRQAVGSSRTLQGDKKTYQMDPANGLEALREVEMDLAEGADMVMVKPGITQLDIVHRIKQRFEVPVFAYQVSGEYAMLKDAAATGSLDYDGVLIESLLAFRRAGADAIITYGALDAARLIGQAGR